MRQMTKTTRERKADQRHRDQIAGWKEVTVRVAADRADAVRNYAASLPDPPTFGERLEACARDACVEIQKVYDLACQHTVTELTRRS